MVNADTLKKAIVLPEEYERAENGEINLDSR